MERRNFVCDALQRGDRSVMPLETIKELDDIFKEIAREDTQALIRKDLLLDTEFAQEQINKASEKSIKSHTAKLSENES